MTNHTTPESDGGPSGRPVLTPRQAALTAGKYHLLAGAACVALFVLFELPSVHFAFIRLGWCLGPWPDFPLPYDRADFTWVHGPLDVVVGTQVIVLIAFSSLLVLVHGAAFRVTALLHRWFGWPRYWSDIRDSLSLRTAWAESARRSWWIWPAVVLIGELMTELATGMRYAMYPLIAVSLPFLIAGIGTIVLGYCYTSALALRAQVAAVVGPEERRCVKCDYRLRGLQSRLCPECAHQFDPSAEPEFRFKWEQFEGRGRFRRFVRVMLPFTMLAAPLWVPLAILSVPRTWLRWIPSSLQPGSLVIYHDPNAFPIRPDAVCRIRHDEEVCVVRFRKLTARTTNYVAGCWSSGVSLGPLPPDHRTSGEVEMSSTLGRDIGPWFMLWAWGDGNMIWLSRPDATYEVEAMLVEDFDGDLSWAEEDPASRP
ncbi:MAG: hypothetical protein O7D91_21100 [Planctomycetota bacterium]|nr:hypothetical protein [Planctomycetota bacterium]